MVPEWMHPFLTTTLQVVDFFLGVYLFFRYRMLGYKLPPRPPSAVFSRFWLKKGMFQAHKLLATFGEQTGSIVNMHVVPGRAPFVFVEDPAHVEQLLTDKVSFSTRGHTGFDYWVPLGLLSLETGPQWSIHRKLVSRCLTTNFLKEYSINIQAKCKSLLGVWDDLATGAAVDVQAMLARTTLDIIASVAFGIEFDALRSDTVSRWTCATDTILDETTLLSLLPAWVRFFNWPREPFKRELSWIRQQLEDHGIGKKGVGVDDPMAMTMIAQLRKTKDEEGLLTEEEIIQEVLTMGGAGHETTANTLSWALYLVAKHPEVQSKLQAEVDANVAGDVATFDEAAAKNLPLTLAVVYETLRLYPTVPLFPRECSKHGVKIGGYDIPKGSLVVVVSSAIHRDARYFPAPKEFRPERFLGVPPPSTSLPIGAPGGPKFAFMPFGAGQRTCVGQRFAILEAVILLASITKRFSLSLPDGDGDDRVQEHLAITLRPVGLRLSLQKRRA